MTPEDEILDLRSRLEMLETRLSSIVQDTHRANNPYQRIFLAKRDSEDPAKWKEWTVNNGAVAEFEAGRECTDEDGPAALIDPAEEDEGDQFAFLMEVRDFDGADRVTRFVKMGGDSDLHGIYAITGNSQDSTNKRWSYTMVEQEKSAAAYAGWTTKSGGQTLTGRNYTEEDNGATGLMGNGVTLNGSGVIEGTAFTIGAIPTGKGVHRVYTHKLEDGTVEYWFSATNPLTGDCS